MPVQDSTGEDLKQFTISRLRIINRGIRAEQHRAHLKLFYINLALQRETIDELFHEIQEHNARRTDPDLLALLRRLYLFLDSSTN